MKNSHNQSKKAILVLHEIYGINLHIQNVCQTLKDSNYDVFCPNLLRQELPFSYAQEQAAYRNFMDQIGFEEAARRVKQLIEEMKEEYEEIFIIGYSIGATISWLCSEEEGITGIVGYYGSRIRDYTEIMPKCPVLLFFSKEEQMFNLNELLGKLAMKNVEAVQYKAHHGFSDPFSPNYDEDSAQKSFERMIEFQENIKNYTRNKHK